MVLIPRFDDVASVLPDRIADNPIRVDASPGAFGAQVGQALGGASSGLDQVAQAATQIRQINNLALLNDATTRLQNAANTISFGDGTPGNPGYFGKQGADAISGYGDAQSALTKAQSEIEATLPADAQRDFQDYARRYVGSRLDSFGEHFEQQRSVYVEQLGKAATDADTSSAIGFYNDPGKFNAALTDGRFRIERQAGLTGEAPEVTQEKLSQFTSGVYAGTAERIGQQDPVAGWRYYQDHLGSITGQHQTELEARLKPALYAWSSRADADRIMDGSIGAVGQGVVAEADRQGVDPTLALTTAKIESGMGARTQSPTSSASGVFGMMPATFSQNGGTDPSDIKQQISAGVRNLSASSKTANDAVGGNAAPWQIYLVHQQGASGGAALLKAAPGESAVAALTPAYGGNVALATRAVTGNGGSATMSAEDFRSTIEGIYEHTASTVSVAAAGAAAGTPTSTNPRDHLNDWLSQANGIVSPLGTADPIYQDMVASRVRARVTEIEEGQAASDRIAQNTLLSAALGLNPASNSQPSPIAPTPLAATKGSAGTVGSLPQAGTAATASVSGAPSVLPDPAPVATAAAQAAGTTPSPRPTSLGALLATGPAVRQAWAAASPDTQRGILSVIERNSTEGPPVTPAAQTRFYSLLSESTRDPATFLRENLADPGMLATMPREYVHQLMMRQASMDTKAVEAQDRQTSMTHARAVVMPDLLAAGLNPRSANQASAQAYAEFDGRLDDALEQFRKANNRRPSDAEIKGIGQGLLTPGFQSGSGSLWGLLPNDRSERLYQAETTGTVGKFYPDVPAADRAQIVSAYGALHNGARPSEAEVSAYYMAGRARPAGRPVTPSRPLPTAHTRTAIAPTPLPVAAVDVGGSASAGP